MKKLGHGHVYGQCVVSDEYKIIYILIPKNASSLLRNYLKDNLKSYEYNYFKLTNKQKEYISFCIIREVISRFLSALNTILYDKETDISDMRTENVQYYVEKMIDTHLVKQIEFIKDIRIDHYFRFEDLSLLNLNIINKSRCEVNVRKFIKDIELDISQIDLIYKEDLLYREKKSNINILKKLLRL